uniref:Uncharacterized protein n=1 Tax=Physcomitrium patens TaxID=3218 RepID=A0A2K1J8L6_PHYPA|nr:hypothetical protein PHYPA_020968 [Physcomitrium patens]
MKKTFSTLIVFSGTKKLHNPAQELAKNNHSQILSTCAPGAVYLQLRLLHQPVHGIAHVLVSFRH